MGKGAKTFQEIVLLYLYAPSVDISLQFLGISQLHHDCSPFLLFQLPTHPRNNQDAPPQESLSLIMSDSTSKFVSAYQASYNFGHRIVFFSTIINGNCEIG